MLRTVKPKNARSKRALEKKEAKTVENPKTAVMVKASQTSQIVNDALGDFYSLKKPDAINFTKKNPIHPFDDETTVEFFSQKNDASLFVAGSHSKKRPHNLVFIRMFDYQILDMMELGIEKAASMASIKTPKCAIGMKPLMLFNGELWDTNETYKNLRNLWLDFFNGTLVDSVHLGGLEYTISVTAGPLDKNSQTGPIYFRTYTIQMKKSGSKTPRVELTEMGPHFDFRIRRTQLPKPDVWKVAIKVPKELKAKKVKNMEHDEMGDKFGRVHLGRQDLSKLQTRKMKGLKRKQDEEEEDAPEKKARSHPYTMSPLGDGSDAHRHSRAKASFTQLAKARQSLENLGGRQLYDHFAGEHLGSDSEESRDGMETLAMRDIEDGFLSDNDEEETFRTPNQKEEEEEDALLLEDKHMNGNGLMRFSQERIRKGRRESVISVHEHKERQQLASFGKTLFLLFKSFIGSGVLFLPKGFANGGVLFSCIFMVCTALLSMWGFQLLLACRDSIPGSYGDIGGKVWGQWARWAVLLSIVISQSGFVAGYFIFTAQNIQDIIYHVFDRTPDMGIILIFVFLCFVPFALIKNLAKLSWTSVIADVFILAGIIYLLWVDLAVLIQYGGAPKPLLLFNADRAGIFVGTSIAVFEGICLILPIREAMESPADFSKALWIVVSIVCGILTLVGALSYAAFGSDTAMIVLLNLPDGIPKYTIQFLYCIAVLLTAPLMTFPAFRIVESAIIPPKQSHTQRAKWIINCFRLSASIVLVTLAYLGADYLEQFVAIVGCVCCLPLSFIYAPFFHIRAVAKTKWQFYSDLALIIVGVVAAIYSLGITIASMV